MGRIVVKIGGATLDTPGLLEDLAEGLALVCDQSLVLVHGGGKEIARWLDRLGKTFTFVEGLRVTDEDSVEIVEMVLSGAINKRIVAALSSAGFKAVGISGKDMRLLEVKKLLKDGVDLGFVGEIARVRPELVEILLEKGILPVISPISIGIEDNATYNVNADHAATEIAQALKADDLIFITDVPGILVAGQIRRTILADEIERLISEGQITGGMIPKARSCAKAVEKGVRRVHIVGWEGPNTILNSISLSYNDSKDSGTMIKG